MRFTRRLVTSRRTVASCLALVLLAGCTGQQTASPSVAPPSPSATASPSPTPEPTPTPSPTPEPTPTPTPFDQALLDSRVTLLLLGQDVNSRRASFGLETNTDSMVVVSISPDRTRIDMVGMPRDVVDLPMADGSVWTNKVNQLSRFMGLEALRGTFETTLGIEIDYYAQVDMDDFARLVDAIGGVDVEVPYPLYDSTMDFAVDAGWQHLDGARAQYYARSRKQDGDYARAGRQQQLLAAIFAKITDPEQEIDPLRLLRAVRNLQTDIPDDKLPTLIEIARQSRGAAVTTQVLGAPQGFALFEGLQGPRGWVMIPNIEAMRGYTQSVMGGD